MLHTISYVSSATGQVSNAITQVREIAKTARKFNGLNAVTGLLIYESGHFFQTLEGARDTVQGLFYRIQSDPRHYNVKVVMDEPIEQRSFADWSLDTYYVNVPELLDLSVVGKLEALFFPDFSDFTVDRGKLSAATQKLAKELEFFRMPINEPVQIQDKKAP